MKIRRSVILVLLLIASISVYPVTSFFELSVGGGWSSLGYGLDTRSMPTLSGSQNGSYGYGAHIGYGVLFNPYVGIGIGADFTRYGASAKLSGRAIWQDVSDTEGEQYSHVTHIHRWTDQQAIFYLEIPISLYVRFPVSDRSAVYAQLGAKACLPMLSKAHYAGELSHSGSYEPWMMEISEVPNHGFYSSVMDQDYLFKTRFGMAGFVKVGFEGAVDSDERVWLYGAVYGTMFFMPALDGNASGQDLGWRNDTNDPAQYEAHSFMSDYSPLHTTVLATGKGMPFAVGAEIGVRFKIPHPKRHRCMCYQW